MKTIILISALIAIASARAVENLDDPKHHNVLKQAFDLQPNGYYEHEFETDGGLRQSEVGVGGGSVVGESTYTAPDGTVIELKYVADENGYQPIGAHIPTPPPVPEAIVRALEYIREHPYKEEEVISARSGKKQ